MFLLALCAAAPPQTRILLYDFEARGVDVSVTRLNTQVLRDALIGTYKYVVVDPAPGTFCYNVLAAADSARKYGAARALIGNIMAIGGKQFLTYQLVDAASSTIILADKLDLPPIDEFPTMAERIAAAIVKRKAFAATIEPDRILETEVTGSWPKHPRRPYAGIQMTAGFLYFEQEPLVDLNLAVSIETPHMLTMLQFGFLSFGLLSHYVAGRGDFAPFYGGGVGIIRSESSDGALVLSAGGGVIGLRTYYFRLIAAGYLNLAIGSLDRPSTLGARVMFGVSSPSFGPDATIKTSLGCAGAAVGAVLLTGLCLMLAG